MTPLRAQAEQVAEGIYNGGAHHGLSLVELTTALEAFAKRVQEEEREACAKVSEDFDYGKDASPLDPFERRIKVRIAAAIRKLKA